MKKLFIISNIFWLSAFCFMACEKDFNVASADCKTFCYNFDKDNFTGLNSFVAQTLASNYRNTLTGANANETRSVWFDLEVLKKFIYQIERSACQLNCKESKTGLGIRFYFGKYPKQTDAIASDARFSFLQNIPQFYGRNTLFMVPTYYNNTTGITDFDPRWSQRNDASTCAPQSISSIIDKKYKDASNPNAAQFFMLGVQSGGDDPNTMQNHQPLCPPFNCPGSSF